MLVLSRKVGERLIIGDNITLVVNRVVGNRVTLGIEAPNSVRVVRAELKPVVQQFEVEMEEASAPSLAWTSNTFDRTEDTRSASVPRLAK